MAFGLNDTATAAQSITFELDILKDDNFIEVCVNSLSEALNYNTETWYDICSGGFSSSATTAIDLEWSSEMVTRFGTASAQLLKQRFDLGAINNIPMRIKNTLLDEQLEINVSLTSMDMDLVAEELQKSSFTIKPFAGAPVITSPIPVTP